MVCGEKIHVIRELSGNALLEASQQRHHTAFRSIGPMMHPQLVRHATKASKSILKGITFLKWKALMYVSDWFARDLVSTIGNTASSKRH